MKKIATLLLTLLAPLPASAQTLIPGDVALTKGSDAAGKPLFILSITGTIAYPMGDTTVELLTKLQPGQPLLVRLNSPGGSNNEGTRIVEALRKERAAGRHVHASVENGEICASMCVPIFMQGERRYAGEGSLFMFHGATRPAYSNVPNFYKTEEVLELFLQAGMSKAWLDTLRKQGVFTLPGAYWISGIELYNSNANVVTHPIPRHVVEEAWTSPIDPDLRPR